MCKKLLSALLTLALVALGRPAISVGEVDFADTVIASVDQATLAMQVTSPDELTLTLDLLIRRNHNALNSVNAEATSNLPVKTASEAPYECQRVLAGLHSPTVDGSINPKNGRPYSFVSEWANGDRVVEHHRLVAVVKAEAGKQFCLAPVRLVAVNVNDVAAHWVVYILRTTVDSPRTGWVAVTDLWQKNPQIAPCKFAWGQWYEPCLNSDLMNVQVILAQEDLDAAATKAEAARKVAEANYRIALKDYLQKRASFLEKVATLAKKYPKNSDPITAHQRILEVGEAFWESEGRPAKTIPALVDSLKIYESTLNKTIIEIEAATIKKKAPSTITCYKGKLSRKVTAISPKCPTGYFKK